MLKYSVEKPVSYYEQIYNSIKNMIFEGVLRPGDPIKESKFASQFQISRSPVREAIRLLEKEGLLVMDEKSRLKVYQPTLKDVIEIYECRQVLEGLAARLATQNINEQELMKLEAVLYECRSNIEKENNEFTQNIIHLNGQFHELIFHFTGNGFLQKQINSLRSLTNYYRRLNIYNKDRFESIYGQHSDIFASIREGNTEAASEKMKMHIMTDLEYLKSELLK